MEYGIVWLATPSPGSLEVANGHHSAPIGSPEVEIKYARLAKGVLRDLASALPGLVEPELRHCACQGADRPETIQRTPGLRGLTMDQHIGAMADGAVPEPGPKCCLALWTRGIRLINSAEQLPAGGTALLVPIALVEKAKRPGPVAADGLVRAVRAASGLANMHLEKAHRPVEGLRPTGKESRRHPEQRGFKAVPAFKSFC